MAIALSKDVIEPACSDNEGMQGPGANSHRISSPASLPSQSQARRSIWAVRDRGRKGNSFAGVESLGARAG